MEKKTFEVKEEHIKLLKSMNVGYNDYCEFGAPEIDPKRPYGNSNVHQDMLEILGLEELKEGIYKFRLNGKEWLLKGVDKYNIYLDGKDEETLIEELNKLHKETEKVLSIFISSETLKPGIFESERYGNNWKRIIE